MTVGTEDADTAYCYVALCRVRGIVWRPHHRLHSLLLIIIHDYIITC